MKKPSDPLRMFASFALVLFVVFCSGVIYERGRIDCVQVPP